MFKNTGMLSSSMSEKELLLKGWLKCNAVIEVMGKPKEHIEQAMRKYVEQIKQEGNLSVLGIDIAETKRMDTGAKQEGMIEEVWTTFAHVEMMANNPVTLMSFCLTYMPASIEIVEPAELRMERDDVTSFFNDLQSRLHQIDMAAKKVKMEVIFLKKNMNKLLTNYVIILLKGQELTAEQLGKAIGLQQTVLEEFLDMLVDQKKIIMDGNKYKIHNENGRTSQS